MFICRAILLDHRTLAGIRAPNVVTLADVNGRFLDRSDLDKLLAQAEGNAKKN